MTSPTMASSTVPIAPNLSAIYPPDILPSQISRWTTLLSTFQSTFSTPATFVSRSPGRVNIIGEHIDYSLYPVLPMAIAADAILAVSPIPTDPADPTPVFEIANVNSTRFPPRKFTLTKNSKDEWDVEIDASVHEWTNYFKSGLRGALSLLHRKSSSAPGEKPFTPMGMRILFHGTVPVGGGLSSSAAFVSASALASLYANHTPYVSKMELTSLAIVSERAVGVNSGGMDQSASVLSLSGSALFVEFVPTLKATPIKMPGNETVVLVAQSFVTADKHVTGPVHYNLRVVECTLAAAYIGTALLPGTGHGLDQDSSPLGVSLQGFHEKYFSTPSGKELRKKLGGKVGELQHVLQLVRETLAKEEGYTREEIANVLGGGTTPESLERDYMSRFPVRATHFMLRQRAEHVFSEALRVLRFKELLEQHASTSGESANAEAVNVELGALMNSTQDSCRDVYDCSCLELDKICEIARRNGSLGSRLTGAGWGGCSVHLVPRDKVEAVKEAWDREYYDGRGLTDKEREGRVVVSKPGSGSAVFVVGEGRLE